MRFGIVISTDEPEVVWNAFRFGGTALQTGHKVKAFLINRGVQVEGIKDEAYDVEGQIDAFIAGGGKILACGTCLKSRGKAGTPICSVSTMKDLLKMVEESERILTFG